MHKWIWLATAGLLSGPIAAQSPPASAPSHGPEEHAPLEVDTALEWNVVLQRAMIRYPRYVELDARTAEADALSRRARSLLSDRPSLALDYRTDDPLDDFGFAEYDGGVALPLWRFGERRAARLIGESATDEARAAIAAMRWEVAGTLRNLLWDIEDAESARDLAREAAELAVEIERVVARRHELGDLPLEDALLAEITALERRSALIESEADLVDAEFAYRLLTDLDARPPALVEPLTASRDFAAEHPLLRLADAEFDRARAAVELSEREAKGSPTLTIGPRRQRDPMTDFYFDSIGAQMSVPFGGNAHTNATTAAARRAAAGSEAERAAIERELHAQLHEALHTFGTAERALALGGQRAELAARHLAMGRTAFEQGEIPLVELLRRSEAAQRAAREARTYELLRARSIAAVNQAVGELP